MSGGLEIKFDFSQFRSLANLFGAAGKNAPLAIARAINHTGDKARTVMVRTLTDQTGLKRQVIVRALKAMRVGRPGGAYVISSAGGNVSLKYFGARETAAGVSASPWGKRRVYAGTFIHGGRFPNRHGGRNGQVFVRIGRKKLPIEKVKSGLYIPEEMIKGETAEAFYAVVERDLPARLEHELLRVITGG